MNNIINAIFETVWHEGTIETDCKLDLDTGEIFDIKKSKDGYDYEYYLESNLIYDNNSYAVDEFGGYKYCLDTNILEELISNLSNENV